MDPSTGCASEHRLRIRAQSADPSTDCGSEHRLPISHARHAALTRVVILVSHVRIRVREHTSQCLSDLRTPHQVVMAARRDTTGVMECTTLPHRGANTAVVEKIMVPCNRKALFLAVGTDILHEKTYHELSFGALAPNDRATFQFLLYLTYCCKGEFLQVTLENTDFGSMSPPIREDFAHGHLFCFVLDMSEESSCDQQSSSGALADLGRVDTDDDMGEHVSSTQLYRLMDVFRGEEEPEDDTGSQAASADETLEEAFKAFMRLQLVRKKASLLNNAMLCMRDEKGELGSMFEWIDICSDTLNANKVDKKKVKDLQGSMYTPACGRQAVVLPEPITALNLKSLENSIGTITDCVSKGEGKALFLSVISKLTGMQWLKQKVVQTGYNKDMPEDRNFMK